MICIGGFAFAMFIAVYKVVQAVQVVHKSRFCYCAQNDNESEREVIGSSDPQIGANQLEFNYQEIEHTLVSVETGGCCRVYIASNCPLKLIFELEPNAVAKCCRKADLRWW